MSLNPSPTKTQNSKKPLLSSPSPVFLLVFCGLCRQHASRDLRQEYARRTSTAFRRLPLSDDFLQCGSVHFGSVFEYHDTLGLLLQRVRGLSVRLFLQKVINEGVGSYTTLLGELFFGVIYENIPAR